MDHEHERDAPCQFCNEALSESESDGRATATVHQRQYNDEAVVGNGPERSTNVTPISTDDLSGNGCELSTSVTPIPRADRCESGSEGPTNTASIPREDLCGNGVGGSTDVPQSREVPGSDQPGGRHQEENDEDATAPPPPYWSVDSANDYAVVRRAGVVQRIGPSLLLSPPPSYDTLFPDTVTSNSAPASTPVSSRAAEINAVRTSDAVAQQPRSRAMTTLLASLIVVFGFVLPVAMIAVAIAKFSECPRAKSFPVLLMASALYHIMEGLWKYRKHFRAANGRRSAEVWCLFLFIWTVVCSAEVYSSRPDLDDRNSSRYCDPLLYGFLFALAIFYDSLFGIVILFLIGLRFWPKTFTTCLNKLRAIFSKNRSSTTDAE